MSEEVENISGTDTIYSNVEYILAPTQEELALEFIEKIKTAKILSDEELVTLVKLIPFLPLKTSSVILSEAIQRALKK